MEWFYASLTPPLGISPPCLPSDLQTAAPQFYQGNPLQQVRLPETKISANPCSLAIDVEANASPDISTLRTSLLNTLVLDSRPMAFFGIVDQRWKTIDKYSRRLETKKLFLLVIWSLRAKDYRDCRVRRWFPAKNELRSKAGTEMFLGGNRVPEKEDQSSPGVIHGLLVATIEGTCSCPCDRLFWCLADDVSLRRLVVDERTLPGQKWDSRRLQQQTYVRELQWSVWTLRIFIAQKGIGRPCIDLRRRAAWRDLCCRESWTRWLLRSASAQTALLATVHL